MAERHTRNDSSAQVCLVGMDGRPMTQGVIPIRNSSLPGLIKLPRRYENSTLSDLGNSKHRKKSFCASPLPQRETVPGRIHDLMTATLWVKQELIFLRQHDILLKRQFFNIQNSIQSLQTKKLHLPTSSSTPAFGPTTSTTPNNSDVKDHMSLSSTFCSTANSSSSMPRSSVNQPASICPKYQTETLLLRPSSSVKLLSTQNDESDNSDEDDIFFEVEFYRPRTRSMRTSRDLAASARRRGSKNLI